MLKRMAEQRGCRFEIDADGTERMIRPDGTVAVIARKRSLITVENSQPWLKGAPE
jgi:hypothetical protein